MHTHIHSSYHLRLRTPFVHRTPFAHRSTCSLPLPPYPLQMESIHSYSYTSVSHEQDSLRGQFHVFQTGQILGYLQANSSRIVDLGINHCDLKEAFASPITVLAMAADDATIMAFASFKEKPIACKDSWIGVRYSSSRSTTELTSFYVSAFCTVRGLRKVLATYACAIACAGGYKAVTIPEPYNAHFACTKTDIMGSKALYISPSKPFLAPIPMTMRPVQTLALILSPHTKVVEISYAHLCGCEFVEELFASPPILPVFKPIAAEACCARPTVPRYFVPSIISGLLDDDECIVAELLNDLGIMVDIKNDPLLDLTRRRTFSMDEPMEMNSEPPSGVRIVHASKRARIESK